MAEAKLKKKNKSFIFCEVDTKYSGDSKRTIEIINQIENSQNGFYFRFRCYSPTFQKFSSSTYGTKSIKNAIKRGHRDLEIWVNVNPMHKVTKIVNSRKRSVWEPIAIKNFAIDLDARCGLKSIIEVQSLFQKRGLALPHVISQTGPMNFHIIILGTSDQWVLFQSRLALASVLVGYNYKSAQSMEQAIYELEQRGIDCNYLAQNPGSHKVRIGGTINSNHGFVDGKPWVVSTWVNPRDVYSVNQLVEERTRELAKIKEAEKKAYRWDCLEKPLESLLRGIVGRRWSKKYAKFFSENVKFLMENRLDIQQEGLAKRIGASQQCVSKHLRKMIKAGLIVTDHKYFYSSRSELQHKNKCKRYTAGLVFINSVLPHAKTEHDLTSPYNEDGETNQRLLRDVKTYVSKGVDDQTIKEYCLLKMRCRPSHKRRTANDIQCVINWARRRASGANDCLIDYEEHFAEIEERVAESL